MDGTTVVIAVVSAVAGAFIGGFLPILIGEKWLRPKLYISDESVISGEVGVKHHRIMIANKGKRAAQNCIGMITLHDTTADDVWQGPESYTSAYDAPWPVLSKDYFTPIKDMPLCWSRLGNPQAVVINRESTEPLEFYKAHFGSHITIPSEEGWHRYRVDLKGKEYSGEIRVTSSNAEPAWASFRLIHEVDDVKLEITERRPGLDEQGWRRRAWAAVIRRVVSKTGRRAKKPPGG